MGSQASKSQYKTSKLYNSKHPVLSCSYAVDAPDGLELLLTISSTTKDLFKQLEQKIIMYRNLVPELEGQQTLYLPISVQYQQQYLCGTTGVINARYRAPPLLLSEQLENRTAIMQPFQQEELLYLAYIMLFTAKHAHENNQIIGDIRPKNIFLFQDGNIQLTCLASFQDQISSYNKTLKCKQQTFLSPQQIVDLELNKQFSQNSQRSQDFAIGMTLISLILLHDEELLYCKDKNLFDVQSFKKQLEFLVRCNTYSVVLRKIVLGLLEVNLQDRITSEQAFSILQKYKQPILNLQKLNLDQSLKQLQKVPKLNKINFQKYTRNPIIFHKTLTFSFGQHENKNKTNKTSFIQKLKSSRNKNSNSPSQQQKYSIYDKIKETVEIDLNQKLGKQFDSDHQYYDSVTQSIGQMGAKKKSTRSMNNKGNQLYYTNIKYVNSSREQPSEKFKTQVPRSFAGGSNQIKATGYKKSSNNKNLSIKVDYEAQTSSACQKYQQQSWSKNYVPSNMIKLEDRCIQTKSIKNVSQGRQKKKNDMDEVLKNIDEQLRISRKMFPDS